MLCKTFGTYPHSQKGSYKYGISDDALWKGLDIQERLVTIKWHFQPCCLLYLLSWIFPSKRLYCTRSPGMRFLVLMADFCYLNPLLSVNSWLIFSIFSLKISAFSYVRCDISVPKESNHISGFARFSPLTANCVYLALLPKWTTVQAFTTFQAAISFSLLHQNIKDQLAKPLLLSFHVISSTICAS